MLERRARGGRGFAAPPSRAARTRGSRRHVDSARSRAPDHTFVPDRIFTPDEANAALGAVRPLVEGWSTRSTRSTQRRSERDELGAADRRERRRDSADRARRLHDEAVETAASELAAAIGQLQAELGVLVKDLDSGLVDFPSQRDGEEVLLCWRLGEDEVAFWHGLEDGFAGQASRSESRRT